MKAPLTLALEALRLERRLVLLLLAAVTITAALAFSTETLPRLGLTLAPIPSAAGGLPLTDAATGPDEARQRALVELLEVLRALGWTALGVAGLTILSLYAISSARRSHELGVHRAVGASRRAILATLLLEALAVAAAALLLGALAGRGVLAAGLVDWPGNAPTMHAWPMGIAAVLVLLVAIGRLLPIHVARQRDVPVDDPRPVSLALPIVQFGTSLALLVAGSALFRSARVDPDHRATDARDVGVVLDIDAGALDAAARRGLFASMLDEARGAGALLPSIASAGLPIGLGTVDFLTTHCGQCFRGGIYMEYEPTHAVHHLVSPDSFAAQRIPLLSGRVFTATDTSGAERVVVINRQMALRHFQPGDPVGRRLFLSNGFPGTPYTVIGVVDDGAPRAFGAAHQPRERVYLSVLQHPPLRAQLLVRTGTAAGRRDVLARVAALAGRAGARTGPVRDERVVQADAVAPIRWLGRWALGAGVVLVLVAAMGLASTMHLWVKSLRAELGIRRALGATRRSVEWYVSWRALVAGLAGIGVALVVLGTVVYPVVTETLRGIPLWQPRTLAVWGACLTIVSLAGALVPARRIARTAPASLFE